MDEREIFIKIFKRFWFRKSGGRKMNLLKEPWIPVRNGAKFQQITYEDLLCLEQADLQVSLPRDDFEMACIQMLAAMTQVIFMPQDKKELRARIKTPLSEKEYHEGIKKYEEWFDLDHPEWPFMQIRDVKGKMTSIQKMMIGMPEESSTSPNAHCFFNEPTEIHAVCPGVTAIALFNQASNSPSFGGGFKGSLRGAAPVTTMIMGKNLRDTVWMNVLSEDKVKQLLPWFKKVNDMPVWVDPIEKGDIQPHTIGLLRGLFWQPAHIEMEKAEIEQSCDLIGGDSQKCYMGFKKERFVYDLKKPWTHLYTPRQFDREGNVKYISFNRENPIWTQMDQYLFEKINNQKEGYSSAAVVANHADDAISLLIGGYKASKASIEYRRHEMYSIPAGWNSDFRDKIIEIVEIGLAMEKILVDKILYPLVKSNKKKGEKKGEKVVGVAINTKAAVLYFHFTEPYIHNMLRDTSLREFIQAKSTFIKDLSKICFDIFERVTQPYIHKPELIGTVALARKKLEKLLKELERGHNVKGGAI
ncbi:MAG TPA: type I-E CRISPR-associated protein Cse1/CasA [Candidatus Marinimicrobia bacterium]|nr:type I-E CRISPR-associated protein Cse1/CasA [Candidatus Neomarinimicrobiota bacterium]